MLMCAKSARDMLIKMSYKGFEIKDDKDFLKCVLSIFSDYLGSIFHDNQQETIFHHLAQSIPYTLEGESKLKKVHGKDEVNNSVCDEAEEKSQSSVSNGKLLEPEKESNDTSFEELTISFDLTSLSYNCSIIDNSSHVIFLETRSVYSLTDDILCKYIYYRTDQGKTEDGGSKQAVASDKEDCHDTIEIHIFTETSEGSHQGSLVSSLPVLNNQSTSSSESMLKTLLIPKSNFNVETGQSYCFLYLDSNKCVLGKSGPFQFSSQPSSQIPELYNAADSDDDGFVIVDS